MFQKIILREIKVGDLFKEYEDDVVGGIVKFNSKLDISPHFQKKLVYKRKS